MSRLTKVTTEVFFNAPGAARTSLLVTTLTKDVETIKREAVHKAAACYGICITDDLSSLQLGRQTIS